MQETEPTRPQINSDLHNVLTNLTVLTITVGNRQRGTDCLSRS